MLFAQMFTCIQKRICTVTFQWPKKARKSPSHNTKRSLKRKLSTPMSSLLDLLKRKNKPRKRSCMSGNNASPLIDPLPSSGCPQLSHLVGVEERASKPIIIYVTPVDVRNAIPKFGSSTKVSVAQSVAKRPAKIYRASVLRRECTSLPSILPHRHTLCSSLKRSLSVSNQRRCSTQSHVVPFSKKADIDVVKPCENPLLKHPPFKSNDKTSRSGSEVSFASPSQSSSTSPDNEVDCQSFTVSTRPSSRNGIAYEIIFKAPSVHCSLTPEPRFSPDYTYSFPQAKTKANEEDDDDDNWDIDGEFTDSGESDEEKEEEIDDAQLVPQCKYGVFFTAAKPPLPPSALERIRRYRNYQL